MLCESGFASDLFLSQMSKQIWKVFFFDWSVGQNTFHRRETQNLVVLKKKKSNRPIFKSFSEMSKLSQPVTEDKRSPKTNWRALKPVPLTHLLIYTDLQLIVLDLITRPKQWYLKCSHQLARLQVIGLFLYSIAKFMKITKLYIFQRCQEHYAYVTDGSVNWKTSSSYKSSGSFSSPSAKNVGNGGFLLQSL